MRNELNVGRSKRSFVSRSCDELSAKSKCFFFGQSNGGGGSTQSTSTSYSTNIPEYAQPYVTSMLNATQRQLFDVDKSGNITGFAKYVPYSSDPRDYIAQFSPMQRQAFEGAANLQTPTQFGVGSSLANQAGQGALSTASQATGYGEIGSRYGSQGARIGEGALGYGAQGAGLGMMAAGAGGRYQQMATDPSQIQAYMNPYVQASLAPQLQLMNQQLGMQEAQNQAKAVGQGAFGGSRQAVMNALSQQNADLAKQQLIGQGYNTAFQQAQQAQQFGANLGLQGLQTGIQGAGVGLQGIQGALAGTAQGMQGAQIGLQGVQGAQAGYGLANQAAGTMGQLGTAQLAAQQGILNQQNQFGAQQQQRQQQIINQAVQDYANAQQYPLLMLGTTSNMLRGLPLQSATTAQYVAQPNMTTQAIGTLGAGASLYNAVGRAGGGIIEAAKYAGGGVVDSVESKLYDMDEDTLQKETKSPSQSIQKMARRIMLEKKIEGKAGGGIVAFADSTEENNQSLVREPSFVDSQFNAPEPAGIVAAQPERAPVEAQAPQRAAPIDTSAAGIKKYMAQKAGEYQQEEGKSIRDLMKERQDILGPNVAAQEYRQRIMEERANSGDESRRQNWMRAAEFFANWGSRPGNTLSAGMLALKDTIPNVISDQKELKKYEREIDKTLYELNKADRAEASGNFDYAAKIRQDAGDRAFKYAGKLSDITEAEIRASAARSGSGEDQMSKNIVKAEQLTLNALKQNPEWRELDAQVKAGEKLTADQLSRMTQIESAYRQHNYDMLGIKGSSDVQIPESPAAVKAKREKLEKEVESNTPTFNIMDTEAKKKKREAAQRELDAMGGSSDNKDRKPLSSFQS